MIYIYIKNGQLTTQRNIKPDTEQVIELERMIPQPVQDGYNAILKTDFESNKVWYELIPTLKEIQRQRIEQLINYDKSKSVNMFSLNGQPMWIDKDTRLGLRVNIADAIRAEMATIDLWYGVTKITLSPQVADNLIFQLELYAKECYDVTAQHIANVEALTTIEAVNSYDYTVNYPEKLSF